MDIRFVSPDLRHLDGLRCEAMALAVFEDERPLRGALGLVDWRLCGQVSRVLLRGHARGALGERVLIPTRRRLPFDKLFLFGAGASADFDDARFASVTQHLLDTLDRARVRSSVVGLPGRSCDRITPQRAMEIFLLQVPRHPEQDQLTLIEDADAQRAMAPVVEQAKRRQRALGVQDVSTP